MRQIWAVIRFEYLSFTKSGAFIGMTIFLVAMALIGPALPAVIAMWGGTERSIAVVDRSGWFEADFITADAFFYEDIYAARAAVGEGRYNYALEIHGESYTLYVRSMGVGIVGLQSQIDAMLRHRYRIERLSGFGAYDWQVEDILNFDPAVEIMTIGPLGETVAETVDSYLENMIYSYVMSFILYMGLLFGGQYLLTTVIREKSTKTMELLITSCKAGRMLNGKVLGVSAAILTQLILMVGGVLLSMYISGSLAQGAEDAFVVNLPVDILIFLVIYFLLGFMMFAYIYAALASTVSRMEDAGSILYIPMLLIMAGFFGSIFGMQNPGAAWVLALSHIPFFAPFVMFMRICLGTAAVWEIAVSIAAQFAAIGAIAWLGGRIYRMGTLMYGNRPRLRDFL